MVTEDSSIWAISLGFSACGWKRVHANSPGGTEGRTDKGAEALPQLHLPLLLGFLVWLSCRALAC